MKQRRGFSGIAACLVLGSIGDLAGQEVLEPTIIRASRVAEALEALPYSGAYLDQAFLESRQIRSVPDALIEQAGVLVQKTAHGHGSPYIRNFTGRQNLLLVDGIRMNNSTWRSGPVQYWNTFDRENLEAIELIKGQGSVLYGSDAIGGTVNLQSKGTGFRDFEAFYQQGRAYYRFDTNSLSSVGRFEQVVGYGGQWGARIGISAKDFGDIRDSAVGRMTQTGYQEQGLDFKFDVALGEDSTLSLVHQQLNQDNVWRWHNTVFNPGWKDGDRVATAGKDAARIYDQERSLTYLRAAGDSEVNWAKTWQATLSYQRTQDSNLRDRRNQGRALTQQVLDLETWGFDLQFEADMAGGRLLYGADLYRDQALAGASNNGSFDPERRPVADDSKYLLFGSFAQYQWEALEGLELTAGARYSYAKARWRGYRPAGAASDQSGEASWDDWSLSLRGTYQLTEAFSVFGGLSQAFRAPNLADLTGSTFSLNGLGTAGSLSLDPERFLLNELGLRWNDEKFSAGLSAYYTEMDGQIVNVDDGSGGLSAVNGGDGAVYGVEFDATYRFAPAWTTRVWGAWQDGHLESPGRVGEASVRDVPRRLHPVMGGASLRWEEPEASWWLEARLLWAAAANNLSRAAANDTQRIPIGGTPSYAVPSLYAGWHLTERSTLSLGVENLFNQAYRLHGSGQNEAGINLITGLEITW